MLRIGARGSALSLAQTRGLRARLAAGFGVPDAALDDVLPILPIVTSGDRIQDRRLIEAGGKGLFTKELDEALLDGRIDIAVHSLKDLPTALPEGIALACVPERVDPRDAFISLRAQRLEELPAGAVVGTASLRRQAQLLHARPDLHVVTLRGNVETRLRRVDDGGVDATFLAMAGLQRLGLEARATSLVDPEAMPPAAGQGALAVTARAADATVFVRLAPFADAAATLEITAERAFLAALDGSCRTPIAARALIGEGTMRFQGELLTPDGARRWRRAAHAPCADEAAAAAIGREAGRAIRDDAQHFLTFD
jgi:hydroxymethylbilane synthase